MAEITNSRLVTSRRPEAEATAAPLALGRLIPCVLLLWALADVGARFMPERWFRIEPVQVATRLPGRHSPFVPNLSLRVEDSVGEQALLANLPPTEYVPPMRFSTDAYGFRSTPADAGAGPPQVVVFKGDSFTYGGALSDEDTIAAALSRRLGVGVYNAGKFFTDTDGVRELDWLLDRLPARRLTVVCLYLESHKRRFLASYDADVKGSDAAAGPLSRTGARLFGQARYEGLRDALLFGARRYSAWWNISPIRIACVRAYKKLYDGRLLPNSARDRVEVRLLPGGEPVLLNPDKVQNLADPPDERLLRRTVDYMTWMRDHFAARGADFRVLLLPDKESVYAAQIAGDEEAPADQHYLDQIEAELTRRGVSSLNALALLRRTASDDWQTGRLAYYREDHHWNPLGVGRVADALAAAMREGGRRPSEVADDGTGFAVSTAPTR